MSERISRVSFFVPLAATLVFGFFVTASACGQNGASSSVYQDASDATTTETAPAAAAGSSNASFDLTQQPNEHPLAPVVRTLKMSQQIIDNNIRDYSCTLVKRERIDGELGEYQHIYMKVAHNPFSVYMSFLKPHTGREVVYVAGQNDNRMTVLEAGFKRYLGKLNLDPEGAVAMNGQKHPITSVGIQNLTEKLLKIWQDEMQYAECEVTTNENSKINGRSATMIQVTHPIPRQNFRAHIQRLFLDNELKVPIHYDAFLWPAQADAKPPLDESYTYTNLKINNGFTARDFDPNNNPDIFKQ